MFVKAWLGFLLVCWLGLQGLSAVHASVHAFHGHEEGHQGIACQVFVAGDRANQSLDLPAPSAFLLAYCAHSFSMPSSSAGRDQSCLVPYFSQGPPVLI